MTGYLKRKYVGALRQVVRRIAPGFLLVPDIYGRSSHKQRDLRSDELFMKLAKPVVESGKTTLYYDRLFNIYQAISNVVRLRDEDARPLRMMEVGVYKGGGSEFIARCVQDKWTGELQLYSVDTFSGHDQADLQGGVDAWHRTGTFSETSYEGVTRHLEPYPFVKVVRGRIQDVYPEIAQAQWDFIHLDVDIASPTEFVLEQAKRDLAPGGAIIVDDYDFLSCPGIKEVVDRFCRENPAFYGLSLMTGQFLIIHTETQGCTDSIDCL